MCFEGQSLNILQCVYFQNFDLSSRIFLFVVLNYSLFSILSWAQGFRNCIKTVMGSFTSGPLIYIPSQIRVPLSQLEDMEWKERLIMALVKNDVTWT